MEKWRWKDLAGDRSVFIAYGDRVHPMSRRRWMMCQVWQCGQADLCGFGGACQRAIGE